MSKKTEGTNSKTSSTMTIHETSFPTISVKLDGTNYGVWSQLLEMYIANRRKKEYIARQKVVRIETDPNYDEWGAEDALVKS